MPIELTVLFAGVCASLIVGYLDGKGYGLASLIKDVINIFKKKE
jgi:hypothetical protein